MTILARLAAEDIVSVTYTKADGTKATYQLTKRLAPTFVAKTDRKARPVDTSVITAYDIERERFISLKLERIEA